MTSAARPLAVLVTGTVLALTGCGSSDGPGGAAPPASAPLTEAPADPGATSTPDPSQGARGRFTEATVEVASTGGGCTYVTTDAGERWALRGTVPEVSAGQRLAVTGAPDDTAYDACPDGRPFLVTAVTPAVR
ncbi:hypothetical protein [Arthrobacter sp. NEB 688]|uniref:hypothetical protein n=1 Tax=Arthrobacter sp. NEB 688 TaxID=904039 RepID=UPI0015647A28|nr:hypothetical protein [Arthrobacter sp. NEB 688]QKE82973.1 hypothetical protein HL663_02730 [Arthrobacter sp. NEB 688]